MKLPRITGTVIALGLFCLFSLRPSPVSAQGDRLVVLVRHAEANGEPRNDPPLTERGRQRAEALAEALQGTGIGTVIVSPLARTQLTAEPLASARGITPEVVDVGGGLERHVEAVAKAVRAQPAGDAILVVGHSNTIPRIIAALGGPTMSDLCHWEFARLFILALPPDRTPRLIAASYGAPDEDGEEECP